MDLPQECGRFCMDSGGRHSRAQFFHGTPVKNVPTSRTQSPKETVPDSGPKNGTKGKSDRMVESGDDQKGLVTKKQATSAVHYVNRPLQGIKICYTPTKKVVLALVYTTRYLRKVFRTYANKVVTNYPLEQTLRNLGISRWLALWAIELKKYQISYISNELAEGKVVKEFLAEEEQAPRVPEKGINESFGTTEGPGGQLTPGLRAWRFYVPNHPPSKCFEPKGRGINWAGNHLVRMLKPGSAVGIKTMQPIEAPGAGSKDSGEARGWTISDKQWEMKKAIPKKATSRNLGRMWEDQSGRN
nr:hypothetical protein [Tanacetum cinerariifolium]